MRPEHLMFKHAKHLVIHDMFVNTVMIIQCCLCAPADKHAAVHIGLGKFKYLAQFLPVIHLFVREFFHGSTGEHHAVKILIFDLIDRLVE